MLDFDMPTEVTPPFLLTMPQYAGTLAAARCLGAHGVSVTMAGDTSLAPGRWSRYVRRRVRSPAVADTRRFVDWLLDFGRRAPGHVLYPTCDELCWLFAHHAADLGEFYRLYQPGAATMLRLLDKKSLHEMCAEAGIDTVPTAFPSGIADVARAAATISFPLLVKPRTQVMLTTLSKGVIVESPEHLEHDFRRFMDCNPYRPQISEFLPGIEIPMLQVFRPQATTDIYSLAGFIGPAPDDVAARGSRKILQRPRRLGVGLCFEEAEVDAELLRRVVSLCRRSGYFGAFEAEFIRHEGVMQLIDFNPRFYGQMGFEIARKLPLAYLVWLGVRGDAEGLAREITSARQWQEGRGYAYCDRFFLNVMLTAQGISRRMRPLEVRYWRKWRRDHVHSKLMIDSARHPEDRLPGLAMTAQDTYSALRHPRAFLRKTVLDLP